jgi:hypothetical protein
MENGIHMSIHNEQAFFPVVIVVRNPPAKVTNGDKRHGGCGYANLTADIPEKPCFVVLVKDDGAVAEAGVHDGKVLITSLLPRQG